MVQEIDTLRPRRTKALSECHAHSLLFCEKITKNTLNQGSGAIDQ